MTQHTSRLPEMILMTLFFFLFLIVDSILQMDFSPHFMANSWLSSTASFNGKRLL